MHRAEIADGRRTAQAVAVKVLRPGVERRFSADLARSIFAARTAERHSPEARRLRLVEVVDTLRRSVAIEMDFRLEAAAISEMAENTRDDADFRVPAVDWDLTAKDVLDARMDRRHAAVRPRRARGQGLRPAAPRAQR